MASPKLFCFCAHFYGFCDPIESHGIATVHYALKTSFFGHWSIWGIGWCVRILCAVAFRKTMGCPTPTPLSSFNRLHRSLNAWFESDTVSKTLFCFLHLRDHCLLSHRGTEDRSYRVLWDSTWCGIRRLWTSNTRRGVLACDTKSRSHTVAGVCVFF